MPVYPVSIRIYLFLYLAVSISEVSGAAVDVVKRNSRPNVLLIVLDDFGYNDLSVNNGSDSPTPNLDQLAAEGVRFTRHYTESSCSPSRASLLTGRYATKLGFHPNGAGIDPDVQTLPELLSANGYTTHMIGKWHVGEHALARPEAQGFDSWFGFLNQMYLAGPHEAGRYRPNRPTYHNPWLESESSGPRQYAGHLSDLLTERALSVIDGADTPWFMYLAYYAPHEPIEPSSTYAQQFSDTSQGRFQALKFQLDENIGRLLTRLRHTGKYQNTMVIVVSDNGGTASAYPSNSPFVGQKAGYKEGGIRTPLMMSWPGRWAKGRVRNDPVMIFDVYPSIASQLNIEGSADLDGVDFFSESTARPLRWYSHGVHGDRYGMLSEQGQWRLIAWEGLTKYLQHESNFNEFIQANSAPANKPDLKEMDGSMQRWFTEATQIRDLTIEDKSGWRHYSGSDFRRTPNLSTHSMGLVLRRGQSGANDKPQLLLRQQGYLDIWAENNVLRIHIDGQSLLVDVPAGAGDCFSLVVTSDMMKQSMVYYRPDMESRTVVYLDGKQVVSQPYLNPLFSAASPKNRLKVNIRSGSGWHMPQQSQVYLSTRAIGEKEAASVVHPELMTHCSAGTD